ncbi:hypothetical protein Tco_0853926 [Tanacetum coccineum]
MMMVVVVELVFSWCGGYGEEMEAEVGVVLAEWWRRGDDVVLCAGWGGGEGGGVRVAMLLLWLMWGVGWDGNGGGVGCGGGSGGGVGCGGGSGGGGRRRLQICQEKGG